MDLIIVESPHKAKTISKYLKGKYRVDASGGHIRDLPQKTLGIAIEKNFEPRYVISPDKEEVVKRLAEEAKRADKIYLATDPDREGEAISWHLQTVLGLDEHGLHRIEFNEISAKAVERALQKPRTVNYNLVDAQQARRVLDRLVGYKLSPFLNNKLQNGLSAGRVQSVALRLIVDREREINAFVPEEFWTVTAELQDEEQKASPFKATLDKYCDKKAKICSKEQSDAALEALAKGKFTVGAVKRSVARSHASAPFMTSTLQQAASGKFKYSAPETMLVAQHLYEGIDIESEGGHVAFITYIRTDSTRVSEEAQAAAREYIAGKYGADYVPEKPNFYASKKGAQDAHEAIRPIDLSRTPESVKKILDKKHYNIYKLVYDRFIASQMAEAQYDSLQLEIVNGDYTFKASGKALIFAGYTKAYQDEKEGDEDTSNKLPPALQEGVPLSSLGVKSEQKFTNPPKRFTDASLVKAMEELGIGRPSTYASIISVLNKRKYVEKAEGFMKPTEIAFRITDILMKYFTDIMDVKFTADMESKLDEIDKGGKDWHTLVADFYPPFEQKLRFANTDGDEVTDVLCPKCGKPMVRKTGKYGKYLACSGYPACSNIISEEEVETSDVPCPKCGELMAVKTGRYGKFLACPNYPKCKSTLPYGDKKEDVLKGICPECGKPAKRLKSKSGKIYYGCSGYPECKFMSWDIPTGDRCPQCKSALVKTARGTVKCSNKECSYKEPAKEQLAERET